jgi:hypothetical protein
VSTSAKSRVGRKMRKKLDLGCMRGLYGVF